MLLSGVYVQDGLSNLHANKWSVPLVWDWNGDGKKDLLVGNRGYGENKGNRGYVSFYENIGSYSEPSFNGSQHIQLCTNTCVPLNVIGDG